MFLATTIFFPWAASSVLQIATAGTGGADDRYFFFCLIFAFWFLLNMGVRQIVDERAVIAREFYAGLPRILYLVSKDVFLATIAVYIALVLSISVHVNWLDWRALSLLVSKPFLTLEMPADFPDVVKNNSAEHKRRDRAEQLQDEFNRIEARFPSGMFIVDRNRLVPANIFSCLWVKSDTVGWHCESASTLKAKAGWFEGAARERMTLSERIAEQVLIAFSLDYSFLILLLGALSGASLGLMVSAAVPSAEGAFQLVPYLTIFQILMSREIIKAGSGESGEFAFLANFSFQDIMEWGFGAKLSLLAVCRYLQTIADGTILAGLSKTSFSVVDLVASAEFMLITAWNVITFMLCWFFLRRWLY